MSFSTPRGKAYCEAARWAVFGGLCGALVWFVIFAMCQAVKS
jgi:hypothetical protein